MIKKIFLLKLQSLKMKIINLNPYFYKTSKNFKIISLIFLFLFKLSFRTILKNYFNHLKVCVCTLGKNENKYVREFVEHYEKYGVDKIYLYDNNDIDGEIFENVINDYNENGFLDILNWRGKKGKQIKIINHCYRHNYKNYDWLIFFDIDEFIYIKDYPYLKSFLNKYKFKNCPLIYLNLVCHTDNNLLYYENKSLFKRFPEIVPNTKLGGKKLEVKFMLRGHIPHIIIKNQHFCNKKIPNCNGFGHKNKIKNIYSTEPDKKYYYIDHFYSKSTEEFINKIKSGNSCIVPKNYDYERINKYFIQSDITKEKIELIENRTGFNLLKFKKIIS